MEKRINNKTRAYLQDFKNNIKTIIDSTDDLNEAAAKNQLLQFIFDYQPLEFTKIDFQKRKELKMLSHIMIGVEFLRANKQQCTRRRKNDSTCFCGNTYKRNPTWSS